MKVWVVWEVREIGVSSIYWESLGGLGRVIQMKNELTPIFSHGEVARGVEIPGGVSPGAWAEEGGVTFIISPANQ